VHGARTACHQPSPVWRMQSPAELGMCMDASHVWTARRVCQRVLRLRRAGQVLGYAARPSDCMASPIDSLLVFTERPCSAHTLGWRALQERRACVTPPPRRSRSAARTASAPSAWSPSTTASSARRAPAHPSSFWVATNQMLLTTLKWSASCVACARHAHRCAAATSP
jgi:hypothetical protein